MKVTTKDIIKILPFEDLLKQQLVDGLDTLAVEKKYNIERILWDTWYAIYESTYQKNLQLALEKAKNNQDNLDKDFNSRVIDQTEKEMETELTQTTTQVDLMQTRQELQEIMSQPQPAQPSESSQTNGQNPPIEKLIP